MMENAVDIPIKNGQGTWHKEMEHEKEIESELEISSPHEGKWDIIFYDEDNPQGKTGRFDERKDVAAHHHIHVKHTMEKKYLVVDFVWSEHRDTTLKINAKCEHK
jgi:hypothetical protein